MKVPILISLLSSGVSFGNIRDLVIDYCLDCHEDPKPKGDLSLENLGTPSKDPELWTKIFDQLVLNQMPPEDKEQPDDDTRRKAIDWIRGELVKAGHEPEDKLARPGFGNFVSHEALFGKGKAGPAFSEPRLWRIRPAVYENQMRTFDSKAKFVRPFTLSDGHGFSDYDQTYRLAGADLNQLMANARLASALLSQTKMEKGELYRGNKTPNEIFELINPDHDKPADEQLTKAIQWLYQRTLLRKAQDDEVSALLAFARKSMAEDGRILGIRNMISAILLKPESLYRSERGQGEPDEHGRVMLGDREAAYALALSLTDRPPDQELLKAVASGKLDLGEQAKRLLDDPKIAKPRLLGFFREYFGYHHAASVFKDKELFPSHSAEALVGDTDQLVLYFYEQDREVLKNLLTSNKSFVQFRLGREGKAEKANGEPHGAHTSYNLPPDWKWIPDQPLELPGEQRAGVLTQPSWLVAKSGNFDNDVIRRGYWIRTRLLGDTLPDLPITVDAQLPEDPHKTLRERMEVTRDDYCWKCHKKMNPLGEPFEMFDHFGRWRTKELKKPVVTTGGITHSADSSIEGEAQDAVEMVRRLAESPHVRQVFLRHVFRYFMGRNETMNDAATLRDMDRVYVGSGGSLKQAIHSLLTSDSFLYRKVAD
ncbi:MAG: DUF1588 domain-containing protein [Akkermansiaceae bacterium]